MQFKRVFGACFNLQRQHHAWRKILERPTQTDQTFAVTLNRRVPGLTKISLVLLNIAKTPTQHKYRQKIKPKKVGREFKENSPALNCTKKRAKEETLKLKNP